MKVWIADCEWAGCVVVIAGTEAEARVMMEPHDNYVANQPITSQEIVPGLVYANYGDL